MNKQLVFGVIAVVFASALIASLMNDNVFARSHNHQSVTQHNHASQSSTIVTGGAGSAVTNSGSNTATQTNTNNGGNAAAF